MRSFIVRTLTVTSVRPSALATARSVSVSVHSQESSSSVQWRLVPGIPCVSQFRWTTVEFVPNVRPMARSRSVPISAISSSVRSMRRRVSRRTTARTARSRSWRCPRTIERRDARADAGDRGLEKLRRITATAGAGRKRAETWPLDRSIPGEKPVRSNA
jgi:hypothetical protein